MTNRREFLRKVAKGTVYAAPLIRTLAAPDRAAAVRLSRKWWGKNSPAGSSSPQGVQGTPAQPLAPWQSGPPHSTPPGAPGQSSSGGP